MKKDLLLKLADYLDNIPASEFDISAWMMKDGEIRLHRAELEELVTKTPRECGSVACALGHAGTIPEFKALGLKNEILDTGLFGDRGTITPSYGGEFGFRAGAAFFGLTCSQSSELFDGYQYFPEGELDEIVESGESLDAAMRKITPADVAKKIREMVKNA